MFHYFPRNSRIAQPRQANKVLFYRSQCVLLEYTIGNVEICAFENIPAVGKFFSFICLHILAHHVFISHCRQADDAPLDCSQRALSEYTIKHCHMRRIHEVINSLVLQ